jgi:cobalamin biosynthesis protein CobD/CbiB
MSDLVRAGLVAGVAADWVIGDPRRGHPVAGFGSVAENTADAVVGPLLWRTLRRDGGAHPSPNAGRMEAAFAGALRVRLGGTNRYGDRVEQRPTLGGGPAPGPDDVDRAVRLSLLVGSAVAVLAALVGRR